jgi:hypothetical protein
MILARRSARREYKSPAEIAIVRCALRRLACRCCGKRASAGIQAATAKVSAKAAR